MRCPLLAQPIVELMTNSLLLPLADLEDFVFQLPALADVADHAGERARLSHNDLANRQLDGEDAAVLPLSDGFTPDPDDLRTAGLKVF